MRYWISYNKIFSRPSLVLIILFLVCCFLILMLSKYSFLYKHPSISERILYFPRICIFNDNLKIDILQVTMAQSHGELPSNDRHRQVQCPRCSSVMLSNNLKRHMKTHDKPCRVCNLNCESLQDRIVHEKKCRKQVRISHIEEDLPLLFKPSKFSINERFIEYCLEADDSADYEIALTNSLLPLSKLFEEILIRHRSIKYYITFEALFQKDVSSNQDEFAFHTKTSTFMSNDCIDDVLQKSKDKISTSIDEFTRRGSGWIFIKFVNICLHVTEYRPAAGGTFLELPSVLKNKRTLLNIKNNDNYCILWCIAAALHPQKEHATRTSSYKEHISAINTGNISFPITIRDIPKLENFNDFRLNIFGYDDSPCRSKDKMLNTGIFPRYISQKVAEITINLLLIANDFTQHYILIKSLDALLSSKNGFGKTKHCERCLTGFSSQQLLDKHASICTNFHFQRIHMPEPGKEDNIKFKNIKNMLEYPIIIVADFECVLEKVNEQRTTNVNVLENHIPCGYAYKVVSNIPGYDKPTKVYRGYGCEYNFIVDIMNEYEEVKHIFETEVPLVMTEEDNINFLTSTICHICKEPLDHNDEKNQPHRDHCHFTGKFRGAAHPACNVNLRIPTKIPVVFHNLRSYDSHILLRPLAQFLGPSQIQVLASTIEKYTSIETSQFKFIDSLQHLSSSLEKLVQNLGKRGINSFHNLQKEFQTDDPTLLPLLVGKGIFPYSYIDSFEKFNDPIPNIEYFKNELTEELPSDIEYQRMLTISEKLGLETLGDLHDHYVRTDVVLLADVLRHYRKMGLEEYGLDPLHYPTAPSFSYDAMLKMTKATPEVLHDIDMYMTLEQGIRGGVSTIPHRLAVDEPNSKIFYTDCTNLYGWSMSQKLPYSNFAWMEENVIKSLDVKNFDANGDKGMILEVDLMYPEHLHDLHKAYPLAPENLLITEDMLSPHAKQSIEKNNLKFKESVRLTPNLYNKSKYLIHIKNLQLYLALGMKLTKIHRVLTFTQKAWLKPYILFNTQKRRDALSDFEKDFFKLLINSIFGKMMENVRKYMTVKLINSGRQHTFYTSKPHFKRFQIISEDLVAVEMLKINVKLNKAIYAGFSILELSKRLMYNFHYNGIMRAYPKATMCFTDTDSLLYKIPTDDLCKEIFNMRHYLDLSNYPKDHYLYSEHNKGVPGFFKDECKGEIIKEFVGLRAKCYSILLESNDRKIATAGLRKVTHGMLVHEKFLETLVYKDCINVKQKTICSKAHNLLTVETERLGLSPLDIKRYVLEDGITTLPYGHYKIR